MAVLACSNVEHTPYSKMPENTSFSCLHVNWRLLPRFKPNIPLNSADEIEATRAN